MSIASRLNAITSDMLDGENRDSEATEEMDADTREEVDVLEREWLDDETIYVSIGWTRLHVAAELGLALAVRHLLRSGADVDGAELNYGWTALHLAASRGRATCATVLLEAGASINAWDDDGETPLACALENGNTELATLLRAYGGQ